MNRQVRIHAAAKLGGRRMSAAAAPSIMILTRSIEAA